MNRLGEAKLVEVQEVAAVPRLPSASCFIDLFVRAHTRDEDIEIVGYFHPDLDCVACSFALAEVFSAIGFTRVKPYIVETPQVEAQWLLEKLNIRLSSWPGASRASVVLVDTASPYDVTPAGDSRQLPPSAVCAVVDHHTEVDPRLDSSVLVVQERVGANATLIFEIAAGQGVALSRESLLLLYGAVMSNTAALRSSDTTERDRSAAFALEERLCYEGVPQPRELIWSMFVAKSAAFRGGCDERQDLARLLRADVPGVLYRWDGVRALLAQVEAIDAPRMLLERGLDIVTALHALRLERKAERVVLSLIDLGTSSDVAGVTYFWVIHEPLTARAFQMPGVSLCQLGLPFMPGIHTRKDLIRFWDLEPIFEVQGQ